MAALEPSGSCANPVSRSNIGRPSPSVARSDGDAVVASTANRGPGFAAVPATDAAARNASAEVPPTDAERVYVVPKGIGAGVADGTAGDGDGEPATHEQSKATPKIFTDTAIPGENKKKSGF
jgi:hypothetical protein